MDRGRACGRWRLAHDDLRKPLEPTRAPPQRRQSGTLEDGREARVKLDQGSDPALEIGFAMNRPVHGSVIAGLAPEIHQLSCGPIHSRWMRGSSPRMTSS